MYIGRFAPSPTGLLHIGSLLTALASYADARAQDGRWLVRMEDLDPPREMAGAADDILRTLEAFGFEWDGGVAYQSRRYDLYHEALGRLKAKGLVYPCDCSRKDWQAAARAGADGFVYNGCCAGLDPQRALHKTPAWRVRVPDEIIGFDDDCQLRVHRQFIGATCLQAGEQAEKSDKTVYCYIFNHFPASFSTKIGGNFSPDFSIPFQ